LRARERPCRLVRRDDDDAVRPGWQVRRHDRRSAKRAKGIRADLVEPREGPVQFRFALGERLQAEPSQRALARDCRPHGSHGAELQPALAEVEQRVGGAAAARAIMTTDTRAKTAVVNGPGWSVGGMAKGAGMLAPGDSFDAQCNGVFAQIAEALKSAGAGWQNVVQFTTYLVHSQDIAKFMQWRLREFPRMFPDGRYPPNTLLVIDRLVQEQFLVEVQTVAAL